MKLVDLFQAVKDEHLTKDELEDYHKQLSELYAEMHLQLGEIKKKKAIFILESPEQTQTRTMKYWSGSQDGLREIELKSYIRATASHLKSLKSRLYNMY